MTEIKEAQAVEPLDRNKKIYVAGHRGLVGSGLVRCLQKAGFKNIVTRTHAELDPVSYTHLGYRPGAGGGISRVLPSGGGRSAAGRPD